MIKKKNIFSFFILFLILHLIVWTIVPTVSNLNLPLDTIEHLAWGSNLGWGYSKHPPMVAFFLQFFYQIFGNNDWAYYLLSQIFVVTAFFVVWKFSENFFKDQKYSLISILVLEGVYFYNFTTPEFNVNVCQLPFWALTVYYCWKSVEDNKIKNWILFGVFAGLGILSKYIFFSLLFGITIFLIYSILKVKKFNLKYFIPFTIFIFIISPHIFWLYNNNFSTITYGLNRSGLEEQELLNHLYNPLTFLGKQIGILSPFFIMIFFLVSKFKIKFNFKDKKFIFLNTIFIIPIILMFSISLFTGIKIRTMWMTPFYLFIGVYFIYLFKEKIYFKNLKKFIFIFLLFFIISPISYLYISIFQETKKTDYPGKEIARLVQERWDKNFTNEISIIIGDEWYGGNLSYHLISRPKWYNSLEKKIENIEIDGGVIYIGNPKILKEICPGIYGIIKPTGICMMGLK